MNLEAWAYVASIFGAVGTFAVAVVALLVSVVALRTQREALPVSADFGLGTNIKIDENGVRWIWFWMRNTGTRSFVHDVYPLEWLPDDLPDEATPNLARVKMPESLPACFQRLSKRSVKRAPGVFNPTYLRTQSYSMFWVSCPPGVQQVKFTAAMSVSRRDPARFVHSEWFELPE